MHVALHSHAASVINGKIYVTGGYKLSEGTLKSVRDVQKYSPQTNSWNFLTPMIENRRAHKVNVKFLSFQRTIVGIV